ncbi:MAG: putative transcriptional regulator YvhJ [Chloroflexi bacterium ADurb.Bin325]|nr:MAG: putative transcriptional regulator YvhJ [Chloroflexi bacterium ADurb.Bin325]
MSSVENKDEARAGRASLWSGLLLGSLLMIFVAAFLYVAYMFLSWGQSAAAQAPEMEPLALPRLVRLAADTGETVETASGALFLPARGRAAEAQPVALDRTTVLLMGMDARPGQRVARTDTIIVLTLNPQTGSAGMLSIPRDLKVRPPISSNDMKITSVYPTGEVIGYPGGGAALLGDTVKELIGYPIDYYVRINFEGFIGIIDLIGGVEIDVPMEIYDDKYPDNNYGYEPPVHFLPGLQTMDGERALKYARTRHSSSDYARAARQQQVIMAIKDKVTQPGVMASLLPRLPGLAIAMANSVETDMPIDKAIALARTVEQADLANVTRIVIDSKMGQVIPNDPKLGYILVPDLNKIRAAAAAIFADEAVGPSPEESARQVILDEAARITVLNGTQEKGLAAKTQAMLVTNGYNVVTVGNADRADYAETWLVTYGDAAPATVEALVQRFNIPPARIRSEPPSDQMDIGLIVGDDQAQAMAQAQP